MHFMLAVCHGGQRIGDGIVACLDAKVSLGGLLKPVDRSPAC